MTKLHKLSVFAGAQFGFLMLGLSWQGSPQQGPYVSTLHSAFGVKKAEATILCGMACYEPAQVCYDVSNSESTCSSWAGSCGTGSDPNWNVTERRNNIL